MFLPQPSMSFPTRRRIGITADIIIRSAAIIRFTARIRIITAAIRRCHFPLASVAAIAAVITAAVGVAATGAVIRAVIMAAAAAVSTVAAAGIADAGKMECWSIGVMMLCRFNVN